MLGRLHHLGFVVASLEKALPGFIASLGARPTTAILHDPLQKVNLVFLRTSASEPVLIELIEPASQDSPVRRSLDKSGGPNHACYQVPDLKKALSTMRKNKGVIVRGPRPAVAFGGRRVAWVMTAEWLLVELLEMPPKAAQSSGAPPPGSTE